MINQQIIVKINKIQDNNIEKIIKIKRYQLLKNNTKL
jgi:hypothetical protein